MVHFSMMPRSRTATSGLSWKVMGAGQSNRYQLKRRTM